MTNLERAREWVAEECRQEFAFEDGLTEGFVTHLAALLDDAEARGESRILDMANGQPAVMVSGSGSSLVVSYGYPGKPEEGK
jgi:hypothetical protein